MNCPSTRRLLGAAALEARVQWRYGIIAVAALLAVMWTGVFYALPVPVSQGLAPYVLFLDTAGFGALFAVALLMFERVEGTDLARAVTPLRARETAGVRLTMLTAVALVIAAPLIVVTASADRLGAALGLTVAGVALTSLTLVAACLGLGARSRSLQGGLLATAPVIALLVTIPTLHLAGGAQSPLLWLVPTTMGAELIRQGITGETGTLAGATGVAGLACAVVSGAALCWWSARRAEAPVRELPHHTRRTRSRRRVRRSVSPTHPFPRLTWCDLAGLLRDPLLAIVALSPVPFALLIRWLFPAASELLRSRYGLDLVPHAPAVFAAVILLHVPMMIGAVVALRVAEDIDDRTLLVLRVSPVSLRVYFGFRTGTAAILSLCGLAVAVPVSGLSPPMSVRLAAAVVLAAAMAGLVVMVVAAFAGNKVEALAVIKGVAAVTVLLPVLAWVLPTVWWPPLLVLQPAWSLLALAEYSGEAVPFAFTVLGGLLATVAAGGALAWRTRVRLLS